MGCSLLTTIVGEGDVDASAVAMTTAGGALREETICTKSVIPLHITTVSTDLMNSWLKLKVTVTLGSFKRLTRVVHAHYILAA